jgi:hypothetical protein
MATRKQIKEQTIANLAIHRLRGESLDVIADEIVMISDAVRKMMSTRLNEDTLLLLIQNAVGQNSSTRYKKLPLKTIKVVIEGMMALQSTHLKEKK